MHARTDTHNELKIRPAKLWFVVRTVVVQKNEGIAPNKWLVFVCVCTRLLCTDFLCFFSRSWFRLCCPSRWSFVSCSSAVSRWVFFFSCWTFRWDSSLSSCSSLICTAQQKQQALAILKRQGHPRLQHFWIQKFNISDPFHKTAIYNFFTPQRNAMGFFCG